MSLTLPFIAMNTLSGVRVLVVILTAIVASNAAPALGRQPRGTIDIEDGGGVDCERSFHAILNEISDHGLSPNNLMVSMTCSISICRQ